MSSIDTDKIKSDLLEAIELVGVSARIFSTTKAQTGGYDPTADFVPSETESYDIKIGIEEYNTMEVDNNTIISGDLKVIIIKQDFEVTMENTLEFQGYERNIISVMPLMLADEIIAYQVQTRR